MSDDLITFWDDFLAEGLLPVGRVHFKVLDARVSDRTNAQGENYKQIGVNYEIDYHEDIPKEEFRPQRGWMNFYLRGKTVQRFRSLYAGLTGRKVQPTGRDAKTGKPTVNYELLLNEIKGLGAFTSYIWRKDRETGELSGDLGWAFAQNKEDIRPPRNPFLNSEDPEEEEEE